MNTRRLRTLIFICTSCLEYICDYGFHVIIWPAPRNLKVYYINCRVDQSITYSVYYLLYRKINQNNRNKYQILRFIHCFLEKIASKETMSDDQSITILCFFFFRYFDRTSPIIYIKFGSLEGKLYWCPWNIFCLWHGWSHPGANVDEHAEDLRRLFGKMCARKEDRRLWQQGKMAWIGGGGAGSKSYRQCKSL